MKRRVYLETTVVSYLTARPSRAVIAAAHREITVDWWERRRRDFDVVVSELVLGRLQAAIRKLPNADSPRLPGSRVWP